MRLFIGIFCWLCGVSMVLAEHHLKIRPPQGEKVLFLDPKNRVTLEISNAHMNRISFRRDRIRDIFGDGDFEIQPDNQLGMIFLIAHHRCYLTVVSEKGVVQDLLLEPSSIEPQSIVLEPKHSERPTLSFLRSFFKKMMKKEGKLTQADRSFKGITLLKTWKHEDSRYKGLVFEVENTSAETKLLKEPSLARPNDKAMFIEKRTLGPSEKTFIYVIQGVL